MEELPAWAAIEAQKIAKATRLPVSIFSYVSDFLFVHSNGEFSLNTPDRSYSFSLDGANSPAFSSLEQCVAELRKRAEQATRQVSTPEEGDPQ